ncbi:MAG: hypothetical protein HDS82_07365 [Bacteroidales bacterium]|nr:hypothetical protein [Bacteroidales bacterium]
MSRHWVTSLYGHGVPCLLWNAASSGIKTQNNATSGGIRNESALRDLLVRTWRAMSALECRSSGIKTLTRNNAPLVHIS